MFDKKPELQKIHKDLAAYVDTLKRGDTMPMSRIEEISGIAKDAPSWNHIVKVLKRHLLTSRGIVIWPKFNGTYSLLTEIEQAVDLPRWRQQQMLRKGRKTKKEMKAIDDSKLPTHARLVWARQIDYLTHQNRQLYRGIHDGKPRRKESMPQRKHLIEANV